MPHTRQRLTRAQIRNIRRLVRAIQQLDTETLQQLHTTQELLELLPDDAVLTRADQIIQRRVTETLGEHHRKNIAELAGWDEPSGNYGPNGI